jgi:hypothetical protein
MNHENILIKNIEEHIKTFAKVFSKPQFPHFRQIVKGTLFSGRKSINSYSKSSNKNQSSLCRFMNSKAVNNEKIIQTLNEEILKKLDPDHQKDLVIDDTLSRHPYGKKIFGLGWHNDHLNGGSSLSHSIVSCGIRQGEYFYPTKFELYQKQADVSEASAFKTKIEIAQAWLDECINKVDNLLIDSWYSESNILKTVVKKKKCFFTMLKSNRLFKFSRKVKRQLQEHNKNYVNPKKYKKVFVNNQWHLVQEFIGYLPNVGKVRVIFTKFYDPVTKKAKATHYLCTNNLNLSIEQILEKYKDRWPIETFYRDSKQNLGFEKCIIRNEIGIKRHLLFKLIAHNLIVFSKKKEISCGETQLKLKYSYIESRLQNYGLSGHNLEACKQELKILC